MRKQKHLWFGKQKKHWEYLGWLVDCIETNRVRPAAAVGMLFKAIPPEQEPWDNPLLSCMMHWNVELIRQSNWVNICCCFIIILKWALSLCMPGMAKYLSAFLIEADSGVYVSTAFNCPEIQVTQFKVKYSMVFLLIELFWRKGLENLMSRWSGEVWGSFIDWGKGTFELCFCQEGRVTCWAVVTDSKLWKKTRKPSFHDYKGPHTSAGDAAQACAFLLSPSFSCLGVLPGCNPCLSLSPLIIFNHRGLLP